MSNQNTDRFNLMLPPVLKADARKAAARADESLAAFIRIAMKRELELRGLGDKTDAAARILRVLSRGDGMSEEDYQFLLEQGPTIYGCDP